MATVSGCSLYAFINNMFSCQQGMPNWYWRHLTWILLETFPVPEISQGEFLKVGKICSPLGCIFFHSRCRPKNIFFWFRQRFNGVWKMAPKYLNLLQNCYLIPKSNFKVATHICYNSQKRLPYHIELIIQHGSAFFQSCSVLSNFISVSRVNPE